ncbi:MAG TPA: hypothetical protein VEV16_06545 [Daejeonella sp.]|nr:hypothetical protein [Daejeonella sp.]
MASQCQIAISTDRLTGTPLVAKNYTDIEGSPYLFDDWVWGEVKLVNGTVYPNIPLKFDR